MKSSFKKFKKIPLITAIVFLAAAISAFVWLEKEVAKNNQISRDRESEIAIEAIKKEEAKSLERTLKTIETERAILDNHFIKSSDVAIFLDMIENLAPEVNATAEVTQVDIAPDNQSISVGLKADGTFEALYKFIRLIENSRYQIELTNMSMQKIGVVAAVPAEGTEEVPTESTVKWSAIFQIKLLSYIQ